MWNWFKKAMDKKRLAQDAEHYAKPRPPVTTDEELAALSAQLGLDTPTSTPEEDEEKAS